MGSAAPANSLLKFMNHGIASALTAAVLALAPGPAGADADRDSVQSPASQPPLPEPGLWEILVRIDVPEGPVQDASQAIRHCYTAEDLSDPRSAIPRAGPDCEVSGFRLEGNRATWALHCTGAGVISGGGEMILGRYAYAANVWNEISERGRTFTVTQRIRARRVGECVTGESGTEAGPQSPPPPPR